MGQKYPKYEKSGQKLPKKGDFVQQNSAKRTGLLHIFFRVHLLSLSEKSNLDPQSFIGDSVFMEICLT